MITLASSFVGKAQASVPVFMMYFLFDIGPGEATAWVGVERNAAGETDRDAWNCKERSSLDG
jgi:hypothetical protein